MLRYIAALAVLLGSVALADNFGTERDANLATLDSLCFTVQVSSSNPSLSGLASVLQQEIADKATLYDLPLNKDCTYAENPHGYTLDLSFSAVPKAYSFALEMLLFGDKAYDLPSIWMVSGVAYDRTGVTAQDLQERAGTLFDKFALAWKKQHPQ